MRTKKEAEAVSKQLCELNDEKLESVTGGGMADSLKKLKEFQKIDNSTDDDGYQISEEFREMIRSGNDPFQKGDAQ